MISRLSPCSRDLPLERCLTKCLKMLYYTRTLPQLSTSRRAVQRFLPSWRLWRRQWLGRGTPLENSSASASAAASSLRLAARAITWSMTQTSSIIRFKGMRKSKCQILHQRDDSTKCECRGELCSLRGQLSGVSDDLLEGARWRYDIRFAVLSAGTVQSNDLRAA